MESDQKIVRRKGEDGDQLARALLRKKRKGLRDEELIYKQRLALFLHVASRWLFK